jgi:hypothetical protein
MRLVGLALFACLAAGPALADPLRSWNPGETKSAIIDFVDAVTTAGSETYVDPAERIATFDNDGNLWAEQPFYFLAAPKSGSCRKEPPQLREIL